MNLIQGNEKYLFAMPLPRLSSQPWTMTDTVNRRLILKSSEE